MWFLFLPLGLLFGALFLLGSLVAGTLAVLGGAWPIVVIALGVWMFLHQGHRAQTGHRHRAQPTETQTEPIGPAEAWCEDRKRRRRDARQSHELPIELQVKVEQIRRKVDVLLGYADRFPPFSKELYLVRQTAADYLPRTIQSFLSLPVDQREAALASDGRTAYAELKAQLELLDARLDEIAQDLQRQDADRLLANRRFLESRFGHASRDSLEVARADARASYS